jgi:hypothetical protein
MCAVQYFGHVVWVVICSKDSKSYRKMIERAFGWHGDALMGQEVKGFLFDVHRQTQGHSQLVTGGGTTATRRKLVSISSEVSQSP